MQHSRRIRIFYDDLPPQNPQCIHTVPFPRLTSVAGFVHVGRMAVRGDSGEMCGHRGDTPWYCLLHVGTIKVGSSSILLPLLVHRMKT